MSLFHEDLIEQEEKTVDIKEVTEESVNFRY